MQRRLQGDDRQGDQRKETVHDRRRAGPHQVILVLRFLHVVAGIAWIGASFYFIRLDLGLQPPKDPEDAARGVAGEYWGVHGGGFYHSQKYRVAPPKLPEHLRWFKWEAYTTWLSGFALLVVLYWLDADTRLVDPAVADLSAWQAAGLAARTFLPRLPRLRLAGG